MTLKSQVSMGQPSLSQTQLNEFATRTMAFGLFRKAANLVFAAGSSGNILNCNAHNMRKHDRIRCVNGALINCEFEVIEVTTNTFTINHVLETPPSAGELFDHMRPITPAYAENGSLAVTTSAGHDEDTPMVSGDSGQLMLGVREDALGTSSGASTDTDGDYQSAKYTNRGELYVHQQRDLVDLLDFAHDGPGVLNPSTVTIPKRTNNAISAVALLAANVTKIQTTDDIGEFMALYSAADRSDFICFLPIAGGTKEVKIAAGIEIFIGAVKDTDIVADTRLMIEFLG